MGCKSFTLSSLQLLLPKFRFQYTIRSLNNKLGCYTFMKNIPLIVLSVLVLCGCSKHHEIPARNLVVAGKDIVWHGSENENTVMRIAKREGDALEGIHIIYGSVAQFVGNSNLIFGLGKFADGFGAVSGMRPQRGASYGSKATPPLA
jgi:hypothetical protein